MTFNLAGNEVILVQGVQSNGQPSGQQFQSTTGNIAELAVLAFAGGALNTAVTNISGTTLTAAAIVGGYITRSGPTAVFTDTTDTAANIYAANGSAPAPVGFPVLIKNTTAYQMTLAAGAGVTLTGNTIPGNSTAVFFMQIVSATSVLLTQFTTNPITAPGNLANTAISTVGAGTLTAAAIAGQVITRSGPTAAFTDTTDTAANIITAMPFLIGQSTVLQIINTTAFPETLAGGTGVSFTGPLSGPIPANSSVRILATAPTGTTVTMQIIDVAYNSSNGYDPSTVSTQFGASTGTFLEEGNLNRQVLGVGVSPGTINNDNVLAVYTIPASGFDQTGRGVNITASGSFGATANNKRVKIIFNATTATIGSAVTGGVTVADTGTVATNSGGWEVEASIFKYGAAGSNTQLGIHNQAQTGGTVSALLSPALITATESGAIIVAVTGNATTATTDIVFNWLEVNAMN
jgi:hypothetical protein